MTFLSELEKGDDFPSLSRLLHEIKGYSKERKILTMTRETNLG